MPEHSNWLTLILSSLQEQLNQNAGVIGESFMGHAAPTWHSFEPIFAACGVVLLILFVARSLRFQLMDLDAAVIPDEKLTLRTAVEAFLSYFYDMAKGVMDAERAKKYFPLIGASALFVFISNVMALLPGMPVATSSLNITLGCAAVVFVLFNIYGLLANGLGYIKHLMGPAWYLYWLIFPIEVVSLCVRPVTLAVRLMLNMSVDHLILGIIMGMCTLFLPLPIMLLGCIVIVVQTLVFTLLTCVYIGLATDHEAH